MVLADGPAPAPAGPGPTAHARHRASARAGDRRWARRLARHRPALAPPRPPVMAAASAVTLTARLAPPALYARPLPPTAPDAGNWDRFEPLFARWGRAAD